jgi:hypothetical protein
LFAQLDDSEPEDNVVVEAVTDDFETFCWTLSWLKTFSLSSSVLFPFLEISWFFPYFLLVGTLLASCWIHKSKYAHGNAHRMDMDSWLLLVMRNSQLYHDVASVDFVCGIFRGPD